MVSFVAMVKFKLAVIGSDGSTHIRFCPRSYFTGSSSLSPATRVASLTLGEVSGLTDSEIHHLLCRAVQAMLL